MKNLLSDSVLFVSCTSICQVPILTVMKFAGEFELVLLDQTGSSTCNNRSIVLLLLMVVHQHHLVAITREKVFFRKTALSTNKMHTVRSAILFSVMSCM